jgi:hypothetical protein
MRPGRIMLALGSLFAVMAIGWTMLTVTSTSVYSKAALSVCFPLRRRRHRRSLQLEVPRRPAYAMLRGVGLRFVKVVTLPHGSWGRQSPWFRLRVDNLRG